MAASRTARNADPRPVVAVACSGGRDSMALLHATAHAAQALNLRVVALHVHHGLVSDASAWERHVRDTCQAWAAAGLPLGVAIARLKSGPAAGESVEAWARAQRYAALARLARRRGADLVLLAHHRRDQAETFLLQALRGAGVAGLSGMPRSVLRDGIVWSRPWLDRPREALEAYVEQHGISHVDDASNDDTRFARNRLRQAVWPTLREAFPAVEATLADSATWCQQAAAVLTEIAQADLADVSLPHGIDIGRWQALSPGRRIGVLRAWLAEQGLVAPATLLQRLGVELDPASTRRWAVRGAWLQSHRGVLHCLPASGPPPDSASSAPATLAILRAGRYRLPQWQAVLQVRRVEEGGVPLAWLGHAEWRPRTGGERFQAGFGRPPRSLKKQFQAAGMPAWLRDAPLLYSGGQLVFVPGLGLDARVIAPPGQAQVSLTWLRRDAAAD